jgi:phosphoribosylcarboxyaminoimidazole (NCAIR) mutase
VAINNGTNAGLLAVQILGACILHLGGDGKYMKEMEKEVIEGGKLELLGRVTK